MMSTPRTSTLAVVAAVTSLALGAPAALAEVRKVDQTVFGMDCAPCAYGVEKGLKKLQGVKDVTVSLNQGKAVVQLKPDNRVTIEKIREVIRNGGFTPKSARVEIAGKLSREGGKLQLVTEHGARYTLAADAKAGEAWEKVQKAKHGSGVVVKGDVPEKDATRVTVREFAAA